MALYKGFQCKPGIEESMNPKPIYLNDNYKGSEKLLNKVALITGCDSGIGRAVACAFAKEGADIVITYLNEKNDTEKTKKEIEKIGQKCWILQAHLEKSTH